MFEDFVKVFHPRIFFICVTFNKFVDTCFFGFGEALLISYKFGFAEYEGVYFDCLFGFGKVCMGLVAGDASVNLMEKLGIPVRFGDYKSAAAFEVDSGGTSGREEHDEYFVVVVAFDGVAFLREGFFAGD